jgi:hypothetical protein
MGLDKFLLDTVIVMLDKYIAELEDEKAALEKERSKLDSHVPPQVLEELNDDLEVLEGRIANAQTAVDALEAL